MYPKKIINPIKKKYIWNKQPNNCLPFSTRSFPYYCGKGTPYRKTPGRSRVGYYWNSYAGGIRICLKLKQ